MTKVINFAAGPGAGKSTLAGELFGYMKRKRFNVEYVSEFAKDLTWRKSDSIKDQLYILGEQNHRLYTLLGQCDYIVTDSPLFLGAVYLDEANDKYRANVDHPVWFRALKTMTIQTFFQYDNVTFFVNRKGREYMTVGRNHTEDQAHKIDNDVQNLMGFHGIRYWEVSSLDDVLRHLEV